MYVYIIKKKKIKKVLHQAAKHNIHFFSDSKKGHSREKDDKNSSKVASSAGYVVYIQNSSRLKKLNPGSASTVSSSKK